MKIPNLISIHFYNIYQYLTSPDRLLVSLSCFLFFFFVHFQNLIRYLEIELKLQSLGFVYQLLFFYFIILFDDLKLNLDVNIIIIKNNKENICCFLANENSNRFRKRDKVLHYGKRILRTVRIFLILLKIN
jgi:hypothetical protein